MNPAAQILVVEDEHEIRELISLHLLRQGFKVQECATGEEALKRIQNDKYDLLVLDWMLPGLSGVEILKQIRSWPEHIDTPVLMVTAMAEPEKVVEGLESGADDYLTKPFEPKVLVARVKALLRRLERKKQPAKTAEASELRHQDLVLNPLTYEAHCGGQSLYLTASEFKLLAALMENSGVVMTRDRLVEEIQGEGVNVVGRTIDTHIFGIRKKMGPCADYIETIRGVGYRIRAIE